MWAGGPPNPVIPIRPHSRAMVGRLTRSAAGSVTLSGRFRAGWHVPDQRNEEADPRRQIGRDRLEDGIGLFGGPLLEPRVCDAPVHRLMLARELRAYLADAVAQRDDVVERLARELVQVLGPPARDVDASLGHGPDRVRVDALGMTSCAEDLHHGARDLLKEGLGQL